jgi:hypothetical protein
METQMMGGAIERRRIECCPAPRLQIQMLRPAYLVAFHSRKPRFTGVHHTAKLTLDILRVQVFEH